MRPSQLLAAVFALSTASAAWSGDFFGDVKAVADVHGLLIGRQDNSDSAKPSATDGGDSKASSEPASSAAESTAKETGKASGTGKDSQSSAKVTGSAKASVTSGPKGNSTKTFDPRLPAGGVSMVTPAAIAGQQYYKIGDWVTFAWNYTSLSVTPSAVDILASCSANQATYTLAVNQTVDPTQTILWDTGAYQASATVPLLTETYTLIIYDADSSVSATAKAGYLGAYNQFTFGMYTPQPYTPWSDYKCPTCNSALSAHEISALKIISITGATTIASFLYFSYNFLW